MNRTSFITRQRCIDFSLLLFLLGLSLAARLIDIRHSPGWYHDETIYIGEAWNLIHGQFVWDTVRHTFLPRLPLLHLLAGPLMVFFGKDILWVRLIAVLSGVCITGVIWFLGRTCHGRIAAFAGAFFFAISSYCVLLTRWGMSYPLDAALGAINLLALVNYVLNKGRLWLFVAIISAALGMVSDPVMVSRFFATVLIVVLASNWRKALAAAVAMLLPLAFYIGSMLVFERDIFLQDVQIILTERMKSGANWFWMGQAFSELLKHLNGYAFLGMAGFLFIKNAVPQRIVLLVFLIDSLAVMKLSIGDDSLVYRMGIILAAPIFVGLGAMSAEIWSNLRVLVDGEIAHAIGWFERRFNRTVSSRNAFLFGGRLVTAFGAICLFVFLSVQLIRNVRMKFPEMQRHYQLTSIYHTDVAERAAEWLNERLSPNDLVITTHMEWMMNSRVASPMLVNVAEGELSRGVYSDDLSTRFVYPTMLSDARYFVLNEALPRIVSVYGVKPLIDKIQRNWKIVYRDDLMRIYENPDYVRKP